MSDEDRARWDARHAVAASASPHPPEALTEADLARLPSSGRALDLACGTGAQTLWAAERGLTVDAVDVSPVAIAKLDDEAGRLGLSARVRTRVADLDEGIPADLDAEYDLVVCQRFRAPQLLERLAGVLAPDGIAAVSVLSVVGHHGGPGPHHAPPGELVDVAGAVGLEVVSASEGGGVATAVLRTGPGGRGTGGAR